MKLHATLLMCLAVVAGCGEKAPELGPQAQVSGSVTNDGKPVTLNCQVVFFSSKAGLTLTGTVDSLGKYSLFPADPKVGVPVGRYTVAIMPPVVAAVPADPSSPEYQKMMESGGAPEADADRAPDVPEKFRDPKTSGLEFEIKEGPNTFDFDLSKL